MRPLKTPAESHARRGGLVLLWILVLAKLLIHLPLLERYGIHGDEFYFLSCGRRPDFGYVDHPPFVPMVALFSETLFGDSLFGLRLLPCLAGAGTILLTGLLAREMGGGRFAVGLSGLGVLLAPVFLRTGNMLAIPSFEPFFWTLAGYILVRMIRTRNPVYWVAFGLVGGLGLLNKHTMLLCGFGVVFGLLLTTQRRLLFSKWLWIGGLCAFLISLPNLVWQIRHDWATLKFVAMLNRRVMTRIPWQEFLLGQVLYLNPLNTLVWVGGLLFLFTRGGSPYRVLGWLHLAVIGVLLVLGAKVYYSSPVYPPLLAAGGVAWEGWLAPPSARKYRLGLVGLVSLSGLALAPVSLPLLPIERVDVYARKATLGFVGNSSEVTGVLHDMVGWEEMARLVSRFFQELPAAKKKDCVIFARTYAQAGAFEFYAREFPLPPVLSNHLSWHFWGPGEATSRVVLSFGLRDDVLSRHFEEVGFLGRITGSPHANRRERNVPLLLLAKPRRTMQELWPRNPWF